MKKPSTIISDRASNLVEPVAEFAAHVLRRCRDRYGAKETPLLTDGIHLKTGEPIRWEGSVLSNLACQQNFLRTLDGLATMTDEAGYRKQAEEWIGYALDVLRDPASDLLYWGGHTRYDLEADEPLIGNHELKCVYPYYRFLHQVNPDAIRRFVEAFWNAHVKDWSSLLFNRHGEYVEWDRTAPWEHRYEGGPLPIVENTMLSFINTGSDLIYAGALLFKLTGDEGPLLWAKRLLRRYDEMRDDRTGLGGYQFNHRDPCRVRMSFKKPLRAREDVNETTVVTRGGIGTRYGRAAITWLNLYEALGAEHGQDFLNMAVKDLTALAEHAYDETDHSFVPVLLDGTKLSPADAMEGVGYCQPRKLERVPANGLMFLAYALAYRVTRSELFRQMVCSLAVGMGWRRALDAGTPRGDSPIDFSKVDLISSPSQDNRANPNLNDACALFGLLELYKATGQSAYLGSATHLGKRLAKTCLVDGFFATDAEGTDGPTKIDNTLPLALLHLSAAVEGKDIDLPAFYPNSTSFDPKVIVARRGSET